MIPCRGCSGCSVLYSAKDRYMQCCFRFFYMIPFRETFYDRPVFSAYIGVSFLTGTSTMRLSVRCHLCFLSQSEKSGIAGLCACLFLFSLRVACIWPWGIRILRFTGCFDGSRLLGYFRVPQRIALYATAPLIALCALCAAELWKEKNCVDGLYCCASAVFFGHLW